jgi:hypothetical protein
MRRVTVILGAAARVPLNTAGRALPASHTSATESIDTISTGSTVLARNGCTLVNVGSTAAARVSSGTRACAAARRAADGATVDAIEVSIAPVICAHRGRRARICRRTAAARVSSGTRACAAARRATDGATVDAIEVAIAPIIRAHRGRRARIRCVAAAARVSRIAARACAAARRATDGAAVDAVEVTITSTICATGRRHARIRCVAAAARVSRIAARACTAARPRRAADGATVHTVEVAIAPVIGAHCGRNTCIRRLAAAARVSRIAARACAAARPRRATDGATVHTVEVTIAPVI